MSKLISQTALRKQLGEALRPIRLALHATEDGAHFPARFMGYEFTGARLFKGRGQIGYVWTAYYTGTPCTDETQTRWPTQAYGHIGGTLDECATQLHSRLRTESKDNGADVGWPNQCDGCAQGAPLRGQLHTDNEGHAFMVCQRDRYAA